MEPSPIQSAPVPVEPIVLSYGSPDLLPERAILPWPLRVFHFATAIALPLICFAISAEHYPAGPEWQRGKWFDYLGMIPSAKAGWPFYPLLLFAMYAAGRTIIQPRRAIDLPHIRIGLFTGVLLAWQYGYIQTVNIMSMDDPIVASLIGVIVPIGFVAAMVFAHWTSSKFIWHRQWYLSPKGQTYFWGGILALGLLTIVVSKLAAAGVIIVGSLVLAPGLTMTTFVALSLLALRHGTPLNRQPQMIAWMLAWLGAFVAAWATSYTGAIAAYAQLPTSNPACYIATAATRGHRRFVGRREINGVSLTPQLAMLKAGEFAIAARWPGVHRAMRGVYDVIGPRLATLIRNPVTADLVYVSLKPFEWLTVLCLYKAATIGRRPGL